MRMQEAEGPKEVARLFELVRPLRPHLDREAFVEQVEHQREEGYRLVYVEDEEGPVAAAGFRVQHMLSRGRHLYVDDLIAREDARGEGHGKHLVAWLEEHARQEGCRSIELDSGFQRKRAHRFYLDRGFEIASMHFRRRV